MTSATIIMYDSDTNSVVILISIIRLLEFNTHI